MLTSLNQLISFYEHSSLVSRSNRHITISYTDQFLIYDYPLIVNKLLHNIKNIEAKYANTRMLIPYEPWRQKVERKKYNTVTIGPFVLPSTQRTHSAQTNMIFMQTNMYSCKRKHFLENTYDLRKFLDILGEYIFAYPSRKLNNCC